MPLRSFDYEQYVNSIWYRYLPRGIDNFNLVYGVFGITFSLYVNKITQLLKKMITEKYNLIYNKYLNNTTIDLSVNGLYKRSYTDYF